MDNSRIDRCVAFLAAEGFRPFVDERGMVRFRFEGGHYVLQLDPADPDYYRLIYPCFWPLRNEAEVQRAFAAANHATEATKVAKIFVLPDRERPDVTASIELFAQTPEQFEAVFLRLLGVIQGAAARFADRMRVPDTERAGRLAPWPRGEGPALN